MKEVTRSRWSRWVRTMFGRPTAPIHNPCLRVESLEDRSVPAVTGVVFQDFNANGTRNQTTTAANQGSGNYSTAIDRGLGGVTVTAFDATGASRGSTTTLANGTYSLTVSGSQTDPLRVEFTGLPAGFRFGPHGPDSGSGVQFVANASATAVSTGLVRPADFSTDNPIVINTQLNYGASAGGTETALYAVRYSAGGDTGGGYQTGTKLIDVPSARLGAVYGVAYDPFARDVYTSAYFKRHSGFGPNGTGAVYRFNYPTGAAAGFNPPAGSLLYADLNAIFGANTAGANLHDTGDYDTDNGNTGWDAVGKTGLGGMDASDDGQFVFVMNLADRQLYRIPTSGTLDNTTVQRVSIPLTNPDTSGTVITAARFRSDDLRPFAVQYHNGKVYVGVTYTAETLGAVGNQQSRDELMAAMYELDPATMTFVGTPTYTARLNYVRSQSSIGFTDATLPTTWEPWRPTYFSTASGVTRGVAPQPIFSDIGFDAAGNMALGLRDRGSDQIGYFSFSIPGNTTDRVEGFTSGDTLRAFINTPNDFTGGWTLEANARGPAGQGAGPQNNARGPGGGEFYYEESYNTSHGETSMGATLQVAGFPDVVTTQMDAGDVIRSGGLSWMNNTSGAEAKAYQAYATTNGNSPLDTFGKANGLGGLTLVRELAPVEIGNRVFRDVNANGLQDAGEQGIGGVAVVLFDPATSTAIGTVTTAADGTYYFGNDTRRTSGGNAFYSATVLYNRAYHVRIDRAQAAVAGLGISPQDAGGDDTRDSDAAAAAGNRAVIVAATGSEGEDDHTFDAGFVPGRIGDTIFRDTNDSGTPDAGEGIAGVRVLLLGDTTGTSVLQTFTATTDANGLYQFSDLRLNTPAGAQITYRVTVDSTTLPANVVQSVDPDGVLDNTSTTALTVTAFSDQTRDYGYVPTGSVGDTVFLDANINGTPDAGEGLVGVVVRLSGDLDGDGTVGAGETLTATTGANGFYQFTGLRTSGAGVLYTVAVDASTLPSNATQTVDPDGVLDDTSTSTRTTAAPDDATRDFGYFGTTTLGDRVWYDADGDGVQDAGEPGIAGATVTATWFGPNGTFGGGDDSTFTTTTDASGNYLFTGLPANPLVGGALNYRVQAAPPARFPTHTDSLDNAALAPANPIDVEAAPADDRRDVDFGFRGTAQLGNLVWHDRNANGRQDGGTEVGIDGVAVELFFDANNDGTFQAGELTTPLLTATTAGGGLYSFTSLAAGNYRVRFGNTNGAVTFTRTTADATTATDATDSDADTGTGFTGTYAIANGANNQTVDAGLYLPTAIGDTVWYDTNGNGTQEAGESGLTGVVLVLDYAGLDAAFGTGDDVTAQATATTDASGLYSFTGLRPGTYRVRVQDASVPFSPLAYTTVDGNTQTSTPTSDTPDLARDFGVRGTGTVGDTIFLDANNDGLPNTGEGLAGVRVFLAGDLDGDGTVETVTATTNASGVYSFTGLRTTPAGVTYTVVVDASTLPANVSQTVDPDASLDHASPTTLTDAAPNDPTRDFGYRGNASLGDRVWYDADGDGVQDAGEPGIAGATVTATWFGTDGVLGGGDDMTFTVTTDANGIYLFQGLPVNALSGGTPNYRVQTTAPAAFPTFTDSLRNGLLSPVNPLDVQVSPTDGDPLNDRRDVDFGYRGTAALGDTVWLDVNGNGRQDGGTEVGVDGVPVELFFDANNNGTFEPGELTTPLLATTTSGGGNYSFPNLAAGNYRVRFGNTTYGRTAADSPVAADATDSDANTATGFTGDYALTNGQTDLTVDAGLYVPVTIGDTVWYDTNGNGTQDPAEATLGIPGVVLVLDYAGPDGTFDEAGDVYGQATATTDANGHYAFTNLRPGAYRVRVQDATVPVPSLGYTTTGGNTQDSFTTSGVSDPARDFGVRGSGTVGDTIFLDVDDDGLPNTGEGLAGVRVFLTGDLDGDGTPETVTATTNASGVYQFSGLRTSGSGVLYTVVVDASTLPVNAVQTVDPDATTDNSSVASLTTAAAIDLTRDFGYRGNASLGDRVWYDADGDGVQDAGEPGISGATVTATWFGTDGVLGGGDDMTFTVTTDANGIYLFTGLPANALSGGTPNYRVQTTAPAAFPTFTDSLNNGLLSPVNPVDVQVSPTDGDPLNDRRDVDFGYRGTAALGDTVWLDVNGNGRQDGGTEVGVDGVPVELFFDANNNGTFEPGELTTPLLATTTSGGGNYSFPNLAAGNYRVRFGNTTYGRTAADSPVAADATDSDADTATGFTGDYALANGDINPTVDAGLYVPVTIGDRVWYDTNANGTQDAAEATLGIPGVVLVLDYAGPDGAFDGVGDVTGQATAATDANGNYSFTGLRPGTYRVRVQDATVPVPSLGYTTAGGNTQGSVTTSGVSDPNRDFGVRGSGTVGDTIFLDANATGTPDAGEGLAGVVVRLSGDLDNDGTVEASETLTTTTNASGQYLFTGLRTTAGGVPYTVMVDTSTLPQSGSGTPVSNTVDPDGGNDNTSTTSLTNGTPNDLTQDFGYRGPGTIGDTVFLDVDGDGTPGAGEGITGVRVTLTADVDGNGVNETFTATTDAAGNYRFDHLPVRTPAGTLVTYTVTVIVADLPAGVTNSTDPDGGNNSTSSLTLNPADPVNLAQDFGYRGDGSIGDIVFLDLNNNGTADAGEGVTGVTVVLTADVNGDGVQDLTVTATTGPNGEYLFDNLPVNDRSAAAVTYTVRVTDGLPTGVSNTVDPDGTTDGTWAGTLATGPAAPDRRDIDFGYRGTGRLGDRVWVDANGDGVQDAGEPSLPNVGFTLTYAGQNGTFGDADDITTTATAGTNGIYTFDHLPAGNFRVTVNTATLPGNVTQTFDLDGTGTPHAADATLTTGQARTDVDFGYRGAAGLGDRVWLDQNRNGAQDPGEGGIPGAVVRLVLAGPDGLVNTADDIAFTATTGTNGVYTFVGLPVYGPSSDFRVTVVSLPTAGLDPVGDLDSPAGSGDQTVFGGLPAIQTRTDVDFGYAGRGRIAGVVFEDANNDGVRQPGEPAIPGTVLVLEGTDVFGNPVRDPLTGGPLTATADANGDYSFASLPPGTYGVREVQPGGFLDGTDTPGSLGGVLANDQITQIVVPADGDSVQNNFAELRPARVAGTVYEDRNNNGRQDPAEPGIPGVRVVLTGTDDRGPVALTLTTDANGNYTFPDLRPGTYTLTQTQPPLFNQGQNAVGTGGGALGGTDVIQTIVLSPGQNAIEYRFGERVRAVSATPALSVEAVQPWEVSKRMFLSSSSSVRTASVPDFQALGSVNTTRPIQFAATGDDTGGSRVRVYDLSNGRERFRFEPFGGFQGGVRTAVGDMTGDGIPDVVAAAGPGGGPHVIVYNGDTGAVVQSFFAFEPIFRGGSFVATGDFDGDGTDDLAVAADQGGGPRVRVFRSGNPAWVMSDFWGIEDMNFRGGARVAAGDVNGDGRDDLVVAAGLGGGPRVAVYDGTGIPTNRQNKFVGDFFAFEPTFFGGVYVTVGDVNGDGFAEVIAGAGEGGGPRVRTISGRELTAGRVTTVTDQFAFDLNGNAGGARVAATDLDGDGLAELFVGTGPGVRPVARFFNPRTGAPLDTFSPNWENTINGVFVG